VQDFVVRELTSSPNPVNAAAITDALNAWPDLWTPQPGQNRG
jgi:hypothetical protein